MNLPVIPLLLLCLLGLVSGVPLALTASTLSAWLAESNINIKTIGVMGLVATPYVVKFLWAPFLDGLRPPLLSKLGQRKGWLLFTQALLAASILTLSLQSPRPDAMLVFALTAMCIALFSATQDMVMDALRIELLTQDNQGLGAASFVFGYRLGMMISTAGALALATFYDWQLAYQAMALVIALGMGITLLCKEPATAPKTDMPFSRWLASYVAAPLAEFMKRPAAIAILAFIICYKLTDAFLGMMTTPFLLTHGFNKLDIAQIVKLYGLVATILGGFVGGLMLKRVPLFGLLALGLVLQAATNLLYLLLISHSGDTDTLAIVISLENFAGGIGTTALVAYLSSLVNRSFTATQYALLSAVAGVGRTWVSAASGFAQDAFGWPALFMGSALFALPAAALLFYLRRKHAST